MAAEIIDAGRFDRQTTNDERKEVVKQILADENRNKVAKNKVPTWEWVNRKLARSPEEYTAFCEIDESEQWFPPVPLVDTPEWVRFTAADVASVAPQKKRRRNELEAPQMVGPAWLLAPVRCPFGKDGKGGEAGIVCCCAVLVSCLLVLHGGR